MGINKNRAINFILGFLILLSFFLSFLLWTTGRNVGEEESVEDTSSTSAVSFSSHSLEDTFRPETIALHGLSQTQPLQIANSYELRSFFKENLEAPNLSEVEQVDTLTKERYLEKVQSEQWIEFIYPEELPFGIIAQVFTDIPKDKGELFFDRALIALDNPSRVYFYHTESGSFYETVILDNETVNLDPILANENLTYLTAETLTLKNKIKYLPTEPLEVFYRTYVIQKLPNSNYIRNFFTDTSLVDMRSTGDTTRYIDLTKEVTINDQKHTLTYFSQVYSISEMDPTDRYKKSFEEMNRFENWSDTIILSSYDEEDDLLSFRREIEGIPVFSRNEAESVSEVSLVDEGVTHLKIPLRFANTPINIKGAPTKELESGTAIMEKLRNKLTTEEFEKVNDLTIGYSWEESEEENQVIHFRPNWYILYDTRWVTVSSLLELSEETVYGF